MSALLCRVNLPATALVANTAKTVIQLKAPTNQRLKILGYGFFFNGTTNAGQPVQLRAGRATATFGTFTAATPQPEEEGLTETPQAAAGINASAEPTYTQILQTETIHPQLSYVYQYDQGKELTVKGGSSINFEMTAAAGVNVSGWVKYEE